MPPSLPRASGPATTVAGVQTATPAPPNPPTPPTRVPLRALLALAVGIGSACYSFRPAPRPLPERPGQVRVLGPHERAWSRDRARRFVRARGARSVARRRGAAAGQGQELRVRARDARRPAGAATRRVPFEFALE
jgi:hypothetical protein